MRGKIKKCSLGSFFVFGLVLLTGLSLGANQTHALQENDIPVVIPGDANGDGAVDISDVVFLSNTLSSVKATIPIAEASSHGLSAGADYNGDGCLGNEDVASLMHQVFGLDTSNPPVNGWPWPACAADQTPTKDAPSSDASPSPSVSPSPSPTASPSPSPTASPTPSPSAS